MAALDALQQRLGGAQVLAPLAASGASFRVPVTWVVDDRTGCVLLRLIGRTTPPLGFHRITPREAEQVRRRCLGTTVAGGQLLAAGLGAGRVLPRDAGPPPGAPSGRRPATPFLLPPAEAEAQRLARSPGLRAARVPRAPRVPRPPRSSRVPRRRRPARPPRAARPPRPPRPRRKKPPPGAPQEKWQWYCQGSTLPQYRDWWRACKWLSETQVRLLLTGPTTLVPTDSCQACGGTGCDGPLGPAFTATLRRLFGARALPPPRPAPPAPVQRAQTREDRQRAITAALAARQTGAVATGTGAPVTAPTLTGWVQWLAAPPPLFPPPNVRLFPAGFDPNTLPGFEGRWTRVG